jgi:hypothetical protein
MKRNGSKLKRKEARKGNDEKREKRSKRINQRNASRGELG